MMSAAKGIVIFSLRIECYKSETLLLGLCERGFEMFKSMECSSLNISKPSISLSLLLMM